MTTTKKERALSRAQLRMIDSVARFGDPYNHVRGQSQHGGAWGTLCSLERRALVTYKMTKGWRLTTAGRRMYREQLQ